jgi:hypothetical protein
MELSLGVSAGLLEKPAGSVRRGSQSLLRRTDKQKEAGGVRHQPLHQSQLPFMNDKAIT